MSATLLDFNSIFKEVCKGNGPAEDFCHVFLAWVHHIDDTIDGDKDLGGVETIVRTNLSAAITFAFNPFWNEHKLTLLPLVIQGVQAFLDSNEWAIRSNTRDRQAADVLKAQYQEVFWHVAYLVGGLDHLDYVTRKFRNYHYDIA